MGGIIICLIILVLFISNNTSVIEGAEDGLMLWYQNVIPVLLPFMLLSNIMVSEVEKYSGKKKLSAYRISSFSILVTLFLGVFCGYPLGAKTAADFVKRKNYSIHTGNILIPLCNNSSPMFIAGYIVHALLNDKISFFTAMSVIYIPYILFISIACLPRLFIKKKKGKGINEINDCIRTDEKSSYETDYISDSIIQITYVGIYIIICSIIIKFIGKLPDISPANIALLSGVTEITNGTHIISVCSDFNSEIKTALILAFTSFGGLSAVLQTKKVIKSSGLSIIFYTVIKSACAILTFFLCVLLI